ncbi:uncharacterized protein LOC118438396 [Folsomia candida]|uniref:Uncharacterized protein n=1 Tax=Folsomia candida TaxID=158441 RepID=A0A226DER0_FOLCA|nr:uncharacterized protein LOC118438396 [Folsomia candida]OXA44042.1 hypothetical protein Fcan01_21290 [Folsomia candida]
MITFRGLLLIFIIPFPAFSHTGTDTEGNNNGLQGWCSRWRIRPYRRSSSVLRSKVAAHSKPLYKLYLPFVVSEKVIGSSGEGTEASLEFRPDVYKLQNITRAFLHITTIDNVTTPPSGEWNWTMSARVDNSTPPAFVGSYPHTTRKFDVFEYLSNLTTQQLTGQRGQSLTSPSLEDVFIVRIELTVRRPCVNATNCPLFLDTVVRRPYLKVDFTTDLGAAEDIEAALFSS